MLPAEIKIQLVVQMLKYLKFPEFCRFSFTTLLVKLGERPHFPFLLVDTL